MLQGEEGVGGSEVSPSLSPTQLSSGEVQAEDATIPGSAPSTKLRWRTLLAVPIAALVALGLHLLISKAELPPETHSYTLLLWEIIAVSAVLAALQLSSTRLRRWMREMCPIFMGAILLL